MSKFLPGITLILLKSKACVNWSGYGLVAALKLVTKKVPVVILS